MDIARYTIAKRTSVWVLIALTLIRTISTRIKRG